MEKNKLETKARTGSAHTYLSSTHVGRLVLVGLFAHSVGVGCQPLDQEIDNGIVNEAATEEQAQALSGENLAGANLAGSNLAGSNLAGANLAGANLGGSNLAGSNLAGSNMGGTNLAGNNLGGNNLAGSNLAGSNLAGSNLAGSNLAGSNLAGSNLAGSNLAGSNLAGNNLAGSTLGSTNLGGPSTGFNIHGLAGSAQGMLYSAEDVWLPRTGQCVVMGIGSTAFPKLLGQQSANARMYTALGKLPWGFASTTGGPITLSAWEAIVWGDKTYCVFIVTAPPQTSWSGVAGFIKAVFRWAAPPSQSMDISGIEASSPHDPTLSNSIYTYTGMMNTGAKQLAGTIPAKNYLAGELAFVTATTNNVSVKVDFASWIVNSASKGMILGNVQASPPPTYAETVYAALDNGDGTVQILIGSPVGPFDSKAVFLTDSNSLLSAAYTSYRSGGRKPIPRRCGGSLMLFGLYGEPIPAGKCDAGLVWAMTTIFSSGGVKWSKVAGTTAPQNTYMLMDDPTGTTTFKRTAGTSKTVLSETYVHLWEKNYDQ